ncbi:MAG: hypothetical protein HXY49_09735 [Ignavibacteriaceae bacterium]|nr:hypothetical protein [Ignavibacteriaceae bacterium]
MKKLIFGSLVLVLLSITNTQAKPPVGVSVQFYNALSPYGSWVELDYGLVVWRPTIIRVDWSPYRQGRWFWTSDGWYWDSYEPFGYVVYHYGRWYYDDYYGWIWIPDYDYAPSWVEWRYDDDYIGWAPLPPYAVFSISIGIHFSMDYYTPYYHWNFVRYRHFCDPYLYNYYVGPTYRYRVYSNTRYRNEFDYYNGNIRNRGVDINYVRQRTGNELRERDIIRVNDPGQLDNTTNRERDQIRTFVASRDELTRDNVRNVQFEKSERKTTMNIDKIEIGDRKREFSDKNSRDNNLNRDLDKKKEVTRNDSKDREQYTNRDQNKRNENDRNIFENKKNVQRNDESDKRRDNKFNQNKNDQKNNTPEIKRNQNDNRNREFQEKRNDSNIFKRDVTVEKRNEINRENYTQRNNQNDQNRFNIQKRNDEQPRQYTTQQRNTETPKFDTWKQQNVKRNESNNNRSNDNSNRNFNSNRNNENKTRQKSR